MNMVFRRSGGQNIVYRAMALPRGYPAATAPAATVDIWWRWQSEPAQACRLLGNYPVGQVGSVPFNPDRDENVILHLVSKSADGTPSVSNLEDAVQVTLIYKRETEAPVIGVVEAKPESVEIGITGFTRFARQRRVTVSANADMSDPLDPIILNSAAYMERELPRYFVLSRFLDSTVTAEPGEQAILAEGGGHDGEALTTEDEGAVLPATVYVTVAHSGGNGWTPESNVLEVTFAAGNETGGSPGGFNPIPVDEYQIPRGDL